MEENLRILQRLGALRNRSKDNVSIYLSVRNEHSSTAEPVINGGESRVHYTRSYESVVTQLVGQIKLSVLFTWV